jgi:3-oxoadipate enol-lactonase
MLSKDTEQLIVNLSQAIISVKALVNALEKPVYVAPVVDGKLTPIMQSKISPPMGSIGIEFLLDRIAARIDIYYKFEFCLNTASKLTAFDYVVSTRLALVPEYWSTFWLPIKALPEVDDIVDKELKHSVEFSFKCSNVVSSDDVLLKAYAGGSPEKKAVVIVPACGMPIELCQRWLHYLAQEHYVITWESRGLFGEIKNSDVLAYDVVSQASDLFTVMDYFNVKSAHIMGLCGGAVIALTASSIQPERISSFSLWYGDYELGSDCPKTHHQKDLQILMSMAGKSLEQATSLQKLFTRPSILENIRADLAHLILYPYATGDMLFRYAKLNGSIMTADIRNILGKILQPTLVVTSEDDTTAHPEGSLYVAQMLPNAKLHIEPYGDHLSLFDADPTITNLAINFINCEAL